jgi:hypothetical protein
VAPCPPWWSRPKATEVSSIFIPTGMRSPRRERKSNPLDTFVSRLFSVS